jgi:hypothetical protein
MMLERAQPAILDVIAPIMAASLAAESSKQDRIIANWAFASAF